MAKTKISRTEYQQLSGLLLIAQRAMKTITECEDAAIAILEIPQNKWREAGHFGDAIFNDETIDTVLRKEEVTVEKRKPKKGK